jgi:carbonic anhydrase
MSILDEFAAANDRYAADFAHGALPMPPARHVAVLTCMDARLDPAKILGLAEGDAHVIRNAGGRASDDALRSLAISNRLLGTTEYVVIHHTDCGMATFTNEQLRARFAAELGADASAIDFLPFSNVDASVREDVAAIAASPLLPPGTPVSGFVYDVATGRLQRVV